MKLVADVSYRWVQPDTLCVAGDHSSDQCEYKFKHFVTSLTNTVFHSANFDCQNFV